MFKDYRYGELKRKSKQAGIYFDVMVTGVTGAGKSTTLNALFQKEVAEVGRGTDPKTMSTAQFHLNQVFRIWDTPGLGDGIEKDKQHTEQLVSLMNKEYGGTNRFGFIDLVMVVVDGSTRDMGTTYKLLNDIVVKNFQQERIFVVINQADMGLKGRHWDAKNNKPLPPLKQFLNEKALSVQRRIKQETGVSIIKPVCYSAEHGYNIDKVLDLFIDYMPTQKRPLIGNNGLLRAANMLFNWTF